MHMIKHIWSSPFCSIGSLGRSPTTMALLDPAWTHVWDSKFHTWSLRPSPPVIAWKACIFLVWTQGPASFLFPWKTLFDINQRKDLSFNGNFRDKSSHNRRIPFHYHNLSIVLVGFFWVHYGRNKSSRYSNSPWLVYHAMVYQGECL